MDRQEATRLLVAEYSRMAGFYAEKAAPYHAPFAARILERLSLQPGEWILDIGCGPGDLTLATAAAVGPRGFAIGIDPAEGMIALARSRAAREGLAQVGFIRMDGRQIAFRDMCFDAIASSVGLPITDWTQCFSEIRRILRPGGRLVFLEWSGKGTPTGKVLFSLLEEIRNRAWPEDITRLQEARRVLRDADAAPRTPEDWQQGLSDLGFRDVDCRAENLTRVFPSVDAYLDYMASPGDLERIFRAMTRAERSDLDRRFSEGVAPWRLGDSLVVPSHSLVCVAFG